MISIFTIVMIWALVCVLWALKVGIKYFFPTSMESCHNSKTGWKYEFNFWLFCMEGRPSTTNIIRTDTATR